MEKNKEIQEIQEIEDFIPIIQDGEMLEFIEYYFNQISDRNMIYPEEIIQIRMSFLESRNFV